MVFFFICNLALITDDSNVDIIDIYLDLKKYTLSFSINNTDHGVAANDIPEDKEYNLIVSFTADDTKFTLLY